LLGSSVEELLTKPLSYVDRFGVYKAPFGVAVKVAKRLCKRFTVAVLRHIRDEEDGLKREIVSGGHAHPHRWANSNDAHRTRAETTLEDLEPVFALVREWCGEVAAERFDRVIALRGEVDRLERLVEDTARWLREAGHLLKAARLLRKLSETGCAPRC
jgi:hypothetical protein